MGNIRSEVSDIIIELRRSGLGCKAIKQELTMRGIMNASNKPYSSRNIYNVISENKLTNIQIARRKLEMIADVVNSNSASDLSVTIKDILDGKY